MTVRMLTYPRLLDMDRVKAMPSDDPEETMDDIAEDVRSCIRDGWDGWAGIFARDAARKAFREHPSLRVYLCPECDAVLYEPEGEAATIDEGEGETFRTVYLCRQCIAWTRW